MITHRALFITSLMTALLGGCGAFTTTSGSDEGKGIAGVDVEPDEQTLSAGTRLQFRALVRYADGTDRDVTDDAITVWNTSDPSIAVVSDSGLVVTVSAGFVDISADYKGVDGNEHFAVTP